MRALAGLFEKSLFLRILACFWLAMGLITLLGIAITNLVASARHDSLDDVEPATLALQADALLRQGGLPALRRWAKDIHDKHATLRVYVVDHDCIDIAQRRTQTRICYRITAHAKKRDFTLENGGTPTTTTPAGHPSSWWDVHDLSAPDGSRYMLTFLPFDSPHVDALRDSGLLPFLLLGAFAMSLPLCWLLARYIDHPVRQLALGARALGDGHAPARIDVRLLKRNDGLGSLARAFGHMAENLADHLHSRERLLGNVSHELRSPLARLRLALELARRKTPHADAQLDRIEQECAHMDRMVGQLLLLVRLRHAPADLPEPLDLRDVVQQVVADARFEAGARGHNIDWRRPEHALPVLGVPLLLRSVLENVMRNALRHGPAGSTIAVAAWRDAAGVVVEIGDEGPGVAEADLARLFQSFFRADRTDVLGQTGSGLGLAIAATVIRQHGGGIQARNRAERSGLIVRTALPALSTDHAPSVSG